jgi:hypothetical protein
MDIAILKKQNQSKLKVTDLILKRAARTGFVEIYPAEPTKWNYYKSENDTDISKKEDGSFDVEGHSSSDIQAVWDIRWWNPKYWPTVKSNIIQYLEDIKELIIDDFNLWLKKDPKYLLKLIKDWVFINPLKIKQEGWVWVVDALSVSMRESAYALAEEIVAHEEGLKCPVCKCSKTKNRETLDHKKVQAKVDELMSTKEGRNRVFFNMVKEGRLVKASDHMWVCENDPTCFVMDDGFIPFDMRDGWSPEMLTRIIAYWFRVFYGVDMTVKIKNK